ncbi:MAG: hypothetical protein PHT33_15735, partial [bacterium]|nr:hypothetical protein [bacterium]
VVENTSDQDWSGVRLALVSGRPISFTQDLYTPLYLSRPVVVPELYRSLMPVNYAATLESAANMLRDEAKLESAPPPRAPGKPSSSLSFAKMRGAGMDAKDDFAIAMETKAASTVQSMAQGGDLGQAFEYRISDPVNLKRQQSAMLPIAAGSVPATQVSIFNKSVQSRHPLYGLKLKNATGLHLMGGPVTVYAGQTYAGDATFEDLQPGEERLISYALDLGVEAESRGDEYTRQIAALKIVKGVLHVSSRHRRAVAYTFTVKDGKARQMLVEHPFLDGWELKSPLKADERTRNLYRFNLAVPAGKTGKLEVVEERMIAETVSIISMDTPAVLAYTQTGGISQAMKASLERVAGMQGRLQEMRRQRSQHEQEIKSISDEQSRLRENMRTLSQNSDLYKRYVAKLDEQETRIEKLRLRIADLQVEEDKQVKELEGYINNLNLD